MKDEMKKFFTNKLKKQKSDILDEVDKKLQQHTRLIFLSIENSLDYKINSIKKELIKEINHITQPR